MVAILAAKGLKGIIFKVAPIALVIGAVYFFVIRPVEQAAGAPAKAIGEAVEAISESVEAAAETANDAITGVFDPSGFSRPPGTGGSFVESFFEAGADIQRFFGGGLTWREAAVLDERTNVEALTSLIYDIDNTAPRPKADDDEVKQTNALNLTNTFTDQAIAERLTQTITSTIQGNYKSLLTGETIGFGGFDSAVNQEVELRKAIEESKEKYGEWFT